MDEETGIGRVSSSDKDKVMQLVSGGEGFELLLCLLSHCLYRASKTKPNHKSQRKLQKINKNYSSLKNYFQGHFRKGD